jgi:NYN domain-containing protein
MKREAGGPCLSAVFVDYDNIYLSLKRKSEEAAKRFAKDASAWLHEIESGRLITPTNALFGGNDRRIVMNRCYGNPVPRRNTHDNSTDMNSFPFVRHHFLRAGFEVVDCPPLTAQLKNSSDIRMVMDVRDYLTHDTYFDEFIILSGDADFTPVLHRLRAHARRTVIFANDFTAAPYTAISDGEVREADLIQLILNGQLPNTAENGGSLTSGVMTPSLRAEDARREIVNEVVAGVRASNTPVPLEALADRAVRALGHEKTIATSWAGAGSFRELLRQSLPQDIRLTDDPPYLAMDTKRHTLDAMRPAALLREAAADMAAAAGYAPQLTAPAVAAADPLAQYGIIPTSQPTIATPRMGNAVPAARTATAAAAALAPAGSPTSAIQQSIARIHEACQAPPMSPHEYRTLFEVMAKEISENDLIGAQTLANITQRAQEKGLELKKDDVRFVLEVVSEADPWFEQGASANLFAGRFRNFVVARCRGQGLNLSADELDLIDAWFAGGAPSQAPAQGQGHAPGQGQTQAPAQRSIASPAGNVAATTPARIGDIPPLPKSAPEPAPSGSRWWTRDDGRAKDNERGPDKGDKEDFPRFVRNRLRG